MMPLARDLPAKRIPLVADNASTSSEVVRALAARELSPEPMTMESAASCTGAGAIAFAPAEPPTLAEAAELAPLCASAAESGYPVVMLSAYPEATGRAGTERACALAYLRASGALVCADPDVWLETVVLVSTFGAPAGPNTAIVAPPEGWLAKSATALAAEAATRGARFSPLAPDVAGVGPADAVLVDPAELANAPKTRTRPLLIVPVVGRAELLDGRPALVGLRAAIAATMAAGRYAQRVAAGLGPDREQPDWIEIDDSRLRRTLDKLGERAGDHETKLLLAACGVDVTRQAVATTPSAAAAKAKRVGFPVELKPWSADAPTEADGCPVERHIATAASVRRAFSAVGNALGGDEAPVIVREPPPLGRELRARIFSMQPLGLCATVEVAGLPGPLAAPAPLCEIDADELAHAVTATRAGELEPDRAALAELLRRASHLVAHSERIESLDLVRIIAGPRGDRSVVVDARATLQR